MFFLVKKPGPQILIIFIKKASKILKLTQTDPTPELYRFAGLKLAKKYYETDPKPGKHLPPRLARTISQVTYCQVSRHQIALSVRTPTHLSGDSSNRRAGACTYQHTKAATALQLQF
jgi:hypothetical protein